MRLSYADIKNFRSIDNVKVDFDPRCRILVGINESGKTNILQALSLLDPKRKITPDDLRTFPPDEDPNQEAYVRFVFSLDKQEREKNYESVSNKVYTKDLGIPIMEYRGSKLTLGQYIDSRTEGLYIVLIKDAKRYSTCWSLREGYSVIDGWFKPSAQCPANFQVKNSKGEAITLNSYALVHESVANEIPKEYLTKVEPKDVYELGKEWMVKLVEQNLPSCLYWSYSDAHLLPGQIGLDAFAANPDSCEPLKHMFMLADIDEIPKAIATAKTQANGIRNLLNRVAVRATQHMKSVWKEYRGIAIVLEPNGPHIDASIKDEYNLYDFKRRSDGFKRFITFLLMVSAKVRTEDLVNTLYLHDEPDVSLHPSGARYLRDELIKIAANNYVVFSTHSIFMIDRELLRRHLLVQKKSEITSIREVDESNIVDEEVIYNALGYSIFENLKKKNIIFEGWRDKYLFRVAMKHVPSKYKKLKTAYAEVGTCHAKGVKDIGRITPMLELAGREWIIVSDSDKPAVEQQRVYDGAGAWYRYDELVAGATALTGEDFIKAEVFIPHIENMRSEVPQLSALDASALSSGEPRINVLRRWLTTGDFSGDDAKAKIESLKERIFDDLKPSHIEESYYNVLDNLSGKL